MILSLGHILIGSILGVAAAIVHGDQEAVKVVFSRHVRALTFNFKN